MKKHNAKKCLDLLKKVFIAFLSDCRTESLVESLASNFKERIKCVSLNNPPCQVTPTLVKINSKEPPSYRFTVSIIKCGGGCNTIDDLYVWVCVSEKVKNMNVKLFNFVSRVCDIFKTRFCKTRLLVQDKSNECKCGLNESVCNSKKKKK